MLSLQRQRPAKHNTLALPPFVNKYLWWFLGLQRTRSFPTKSGTFASFKRIGRAAASCVKRPHRKSLRLSRMRATAVFFRCAQENHNFFATPPACWIDSSAKAQASLPREREREHRWASPAQMPLPSPEGASSLLRSSNYDAKAPETTPTPTPRSTCGVGTPPRRQGLCPDSAESVIRVCQYFRRSTPRPHRGRKAACVWERGRLGREGGDSGGRGNYRFMVRGEGAGSGEGDCAASGGLPRVRQREKEKGDIESQASYQEI